MVSLIHGPCNMDIPYIRMHFINDQCAIVGADILDIGDCSARSHLSFLIHFGFVTHRCLLMKFFSGAWYPMGFPDRGPFNSNLVGTLNIM